MPSCTHTPVLPQDTQLIAPDVAQPLPRVRRGHQQTAVLASAPQAPILSAVELRLILAHRKLSDRDQALILTFSEDCALKYPRRAASGLRLVVGGAE